MKLKLFLGIVILLMCGSCSTLDMCIKKYPNNCALVVKDEIKTDSSTTTTDSTSVKDSTAIRDTSAIVPGDSTELILDLDYICDSLIRARGANFNNNGDRSSTEVIVREKKIYIKCKCEEEVIKFQIKEHFRTVTRSLKVEKRLSRVETKTVMVSKPPNKIQKFLIWSGFAFWILIIVLILWLTRKFWLPPLKRLMGFTIVI